MTKHAAPAPVDGEIEGQLLALLRGLVAREVRAVIAASAPADDYLSTQDAAKLASVADGTIRRWIRERRLEPHRAGRHMRVRRADLVRLMKAPRPKSIHADDPATMSPEARARARFG